jgi:hypothetical protein
MWNKNLVSAVFHDQSDIGDKLTIQSTYYEIGSNETLVILNRLFILINPPLGVNKVWLYWSSVTMKNLMSIKNFIKSELDSTFNFGLVLFSNTKKDKILNNVTKLDITL